jgi:hypothetical protein
LLEIILEEENKIKGNNIKIKNSLLKIFPEDKYKLIIDKSRFSSRYDNITRYAIVPLNVNTIKESEYKNNFQVIITESINVKGIVYYYKHNFGPKLHNKYVKFFSLESLLENLNKEFNNQVNNINPSLM